jgi:uncharacterized protein (TIGR00369 family)
MKHDMPHDLQDRLERIPIFAVLDFEIRAIENGRATLYMPFRKNLAGIFESLHGGLLMTLADTAACVAVLAATSPDAIITTTDMNIRFLAPCLTGATGEAHIIKAGRTLCPVGVDIRDERSDLVAVAQVTYMRLPHRKAT